MAQIILQNSESLGLYLRDLTSLKPLSKEEETKLVIQIRKGCQAARDKLISSNLRFVVHIAKEYQHRGLPLADLIGSGNIGLITAAERFDETRGLKFITYAVWWIRQAIFMSLAEDQRMIRLPVNRINLLHRISKVLQELRPSNGGDLSPENIAEALGESIETVKDTLIYAQEVRSLDASFQDDQGSLLSVLVDQTQQLPDTEAVENSVREQIVKVLKTLSPREAEIIRLYFGLDDEESMTLEEIGRRFNLTRERVRQIKEKALNRLRHPKCQTLLESLMEPD
ncbi:MAG: RNA polymerase sigma factor RpoD/SigA [bacterium]|nr:RNA polymerase sigma factor RpoD/SigA [bacterium]